MSIVKDIEGRMTTAGVAMSNQVAKDMWTYYIPPTTQKPITLIVPGPKGHQHHYTVGKKYLQLVKNLRNMDMSDESIWRTIKAMKKKSGCRKSC